MSKTLKIGKNSDLEVYIQEAARIIKEGGLVSFPTDTVYGIGANPLNEKAVNKIYEAKGRPEEKALPLLLAEQSQMELVAREIPEVARRLAEFFFPGGLTLVFFKSTWVPDWITAGGEKVAIRVPAHPIPRALSREVGIPITGTSANSSGYPSACSAPEVIEQLGDKIDLILDGGTCLGGISSTVLDVTVFPPKILREGIISAAKIEAFLEGEKVITI